MASSRSGQERAASAAMARHDQGEAVDEFVASAARRRAPPFGYARPGREGQVGYGSGPANGVRRSEPVSGRGFALPHVSMPHDTASERVVRRIPVRRSARPKMRSPCGESSGDRRRSEQSRCPMTGSPSLLATGRTGDQDRPSQGGYAEHKPHPGRTGLTPKHQTVCEQIGARSFPPAVEEINSL
jgi:hypothetical protein